MLGPGIDKHFDLDEALIPVMADPTQLEVAVLNLAINARDAMPDGGVLTFATPARSTCRGDPELEDGDYIELTISDTGTGMPPEVAERAFEPFFTTKEVGKGTGLGLSMVYGMARQSGGAARIESRPGEGTAVKLCSARPTATARRSRRAGRGDQPHADAGGPFDPRHRRRPRRPRLHRRQRSRSRAIACARRPTAARASPKSSASRPTSSSSTSSCPACRAPRSPARSAPKRRDQPILFVSGYSETDAVKRIAPDAPLLAKPFRAEALLKAVRASAYAAGVSGRMGGTQSSCRPRPA